MTKSGAKFEVYSGKDGDWYWRLVARNGRVLADGGQGYSRASAAWRGVERVMGAFFDASITLMDCD